MKSSRTITSSQLVSWALSGGGGVLSQASPGPPCSPGLSEEEGGGGAEHGDDDAKEDEGDRGGRAGAIPTDAPLSPAFLRPETCLQALQSPAPLQGLP